MPGMGAAIGIGTRSGSGGSFVIQVPLSDMLQGEISHVKFNPTLKAFEGRLITVQDRRILHQGLKIRLEGTLEIISKFRLQKTKKGDIFKFYTENEVQLTTENLIGGQKKFNFVLPISAESLPSSFSNRFGTLTYQLMAYIGLPKRDPLWNAFAKKNVSFDGNCYIGSGGKCGNLVEEKVFEDSEVVSRFHTTGSVVRGENILASLDLQGLLKGTQVLATVSLIRISKYGANIISEPLFAEINQTEQLQWIIPVPLNSRPSFENKVCGSCSFQYYVKYMVNLVGAEERRFGGQLRVLVGTTRDPMKQSVGASDPEPGSSSSSNALFVNQGVAVSATGLRRGSTESLVSLPTYSQLPSRSMSLISLETLPPHYDDLK